MNYLSWNYRVLENPWTVRILGDLIKSWRPDFLFLSETITSSDWISELCTKFYFDRSFKLDKVGGGGGRLAVMWKKNISCTITDYSLNHIDVHIMEDNVTVCRLTCFYKFSERNHRHNA